MHTYPWNTCVWAFVSDCLLLFSRNSGLLSTQQQMQQPPQQPFQSQRNPIGQMPGMSMQGHPSPSHSPIPSLNSSSNSSKILPPSRSMPSSMLPTSSAALSNASNFPGFIGGQLNRNVGGSVGQVLTTITRLFYSKLSFVNYKYLILPLIQLLK